MGIVMSILWLLYIIVARVYGVSFEDNLSFVPVICFAFGVPFFLYCAHMMWRNERYIKNMVNKRLLIKGLVCGGAFIIGGIVAII